ncbi:MAG: AraC family transcriptional regulator [Lachnospiraceae bacterium]|nr:AraC family transcriptional regulator [Lachnospiraceae bacterium]
MKYADPASKRPGFLRTAQYNIPLVQDPLSDFIHSWGFEPVGFGFWSQVKKHSILKDNMLSQFMLVLMSKGQCELSCHSGCYLLSEYDCVIIPPYLMYTAVCISEEPVEYYYLGYQITNQEQKRRYAHLDSITTLQYLPGLLNAYAIQRLEQVYQNARQHEAGRFLQIQSLLYSILIPMFCRQDSNPPLTLPIRHKTNEEQLVLSCMELADRKIHEGLQVADLCSAFHVSQSYLYRSFCHILHCPPRTWLRTFRIEKSLMFLKSPQYTVEQAAEKTGFSSIYHYSRVFKEIMGCSPSQYRKELSGSQNGK